MIMRRIFDCAFCSIAWLDLLAQPQISVPYVQIGFIILLYEMKFLVPNYSCLQNSWLGGLPPPDPRSLCPLSSTEVVEPPQNKIPGYATTAPSVPQYTLLECHRAFYTMSWRLLTALAALILSETWRKVVSCCKTRQSLINTGSWWGGGEISIFLSST